MKKQKYYGLQVHTLTFLKVDENGESIDGKQFDRDWETLLYYRMF